MMLTAAVSWLPQETAVGLEIPRHTTASGLVVQHWSWRMLFCWQTRHGTAGM